MTKLDKARLGVSKLDNPVLTVGEIAGTEAALFESLSQPKPGPRISVSFIDDAKLGFDPEVATAC